MKTVQKCPACGSERVWIWDAPEKKIECQFCKTVSILHPTQAVPHWGPLPDIDAIAKAAHDAFWQEIGNTSIVYLERGKTFKQAWQAAAIAAIKASQNVDNLKIKPETDARSAAFSLWGYIEDVTASNITDDYIEWLRNHYVRNLLTALGIEI